MRTNESVICEVKGTTSESTTSDLESSESLCQMKDREVTHPESPSLASTSTSRSQTPENTSDQEIEEKIPQLEQEHTSIDVEKMSESNFHNSGRIDVAIDQRQVQDAWTKITKVITESDAKKLEAVRDDMDTLLVFAGLFSAVLTAFVIESYKGLRGDSGDASLRVLTQISQQLNSFTLNSGYINTTSPSPLPSAPPFQPSPAAIRINALWFLSLFLSLICSSAVILIKQWLRAYPIFGYTGQQFIRLWWFRSHAMQRWRVYEIAAALPLLLQVALILFLVGLSDFARDLHPILGWVITAPMALWLAMYILVTLLPVVSIWCPYKTPSLIGSLTAVRAYYISRWNNYLWYWKLAREKLKIKWIHPEGEVYHLNRDKKDFSILIDIFCTFPENRDIVRAIQVCLPSMAQDFPMATICFLLDVSTEIKKKPRIHNPQQISMFPMGSREMVVEMVVEALERGFSRKEFSLDTSHVPQWVTWAMTWVVYGNCYSEYAFRPDGLVVQLLRKNKELLEPILLRSCWNEWHAGIEKIRWVDVEIMSKLLSSAISITRANPLPNYYVAIGVGILHFACCSLHDNLLSHPDIRGGMEEIFSSCAGLPLDRFASSVFTKQVLKWRLDLLQRRCPDFVTEDTLAKLYKHAE